jgi:hypothetical protein
MNKVRLKCVKCGKGGCQGNTVGRKSPVRLSAGVGGKPADRVIDTHGENWTAWRNQDRGERKLAPRSVRNLNRGSKIGNCICVTPKVSLILCLCTDLDHKKISAVDEEIRV